MMRYCLPRMAVLVVLLAAVAAWGAPSAPPARAGEVRTYDAVPRQQLTVGKSIRILSPENITRVSVGAKEVADFVLLSPREVYVTGIAPGLTNLMLWGAGNRVIRVYDLSVSPDVSRLKQVIHDLLPDESATIKVMANQDSIALSGTVRDAGSLQKVLSLAESYAPKKVLNLLSVGGVQQIMLEVRVAEMSKDVINRMGINLNAISSDGNFLYTLIGGLTSIGTITSSGSSTTTLEQGTAVGRWNFTNGSTTTTVTGVLDALKENGLARILAEPNLVCLNGQSADFLAGGQIPIPVSAGLGTTTIEWKDYGVGLKFTPTIVDGDHINLQVHPEVSQLDYTHGYTPSGSSSSIPAISSRRTSTTVELRNGQSFAIAGMLSQSSHNDVDKYPMLGDVPILGNLFKSSSYQKNQTELVIIITAHLVKPLDKKHMVLPTDFGHEPDDMEFYLNIDKGAKARPQAPAETVGASGARLDGDFGHVIPVAAGMGQPGYGE